LVFDECFLTLLDQKQNAKDSEIAATPVGEGKTLDRNEILKALLEKKTDK